MSGRLSTLLSVGMALKGNQLRRAFGEYVSDRMAQGQHIATAYIMACAMFAVAGIFLIAAFFVGLAALFNYVEWTYGTFPAFGVIAGLLVLLAIIFLMLAQSRMKPVRAIPALSSRLDDAVHSSPVYPKGVEAKQRQAKVARVRAPAEPTSFPVKAGLTTAVVLMGWAMARRYNLSAQARRVRRQLAKARS